MCFSDKAFVILKYNSCNNFKLEKIVNLFRWF